MIKDTTPVWFITGCSRGFGREWAKLVLERGWRCVVTARKVEDVQDIADQYKDRALAVELDVTNAKQISDAVKKAEEKFGGIDVLVNNAGYGYLAAVEEAEEKEVRDMFETNFFGLFKLTQAVLPGMRKRHSGHIVNISSIAGLVGMPSVAFYNATKFAVEGFSEALAHEVEPFGIKVIIVEPGPFRTDWAGYTSLKQSTHKITDYAQTAGLSSQRISEHSGKQAGDPVRAGEAIIKAVQSPNPPRHLLLGKMALDVARSKLDALRNDFDAWEKTTLSADFPEVSDEFAKSFR